MHCAYLLLYLIKYMYNRDTLLTKQFKLPFNRTPLISPSPPTPEHPASEHFYFLSKQYFVISQPNTTRCNVPN